MSSTPAAPTRERPFFLSTLPALLAFSACALSLPLLFEPRVPFLLLALVNIAMLVDQYQPHALGDAHAKPDEKKFAEGNARFSPAFFRIWFVAVFAAYLVHDIKWTFWRLAHKELASPLWHEWIGAALCVSGALLRGWARRELGQFFTYQVGIRGKEHQLITSGPYAFLLHPGYSGYLLVLLGTCLFFLYPMLAALLISMVLYFMPRRISMEERVLEETFGDKFRARKMQVARLIPGVY